MGETASQPAPTELVCIRTEKVYDFCFEQDTGLQHCFVPLPVGGIRELERAAGGADLKSAARQNLLAFDCAVNSVNCFAGPPAPIPGQDGLASVTKTVVINYTVRVRGGGSVVASFTRVFTFTRSVVLCAPAGTTVDCEAFAVCHDCRLVFVPLDQAKLQAEFDEQEVRDFRGGVPFICCLFDVCVVVQSVAPVKLLVPALGFCVPAPCRTGGFPPFPCPPPLFPPQCTPVD